MTRRLTIALLLATLSVGDRARAEEGHILAVLPLDTRMTKGKMDEAAQASLEEMLRDAAVEALGSDGWTVLTGETTLQVLRDNGVDAAKCGDQNCHLSMAREIKAERFLSGAVQFAEGSYTASFRLIDTKTGRILASERVEGDTTKALRAAFASRSGQFFARAGAGLTSGGGEDKKIEPAGNNEAKIASDPSGATIRIDGEVVGKTPLRKALSPGTYYVTLESDGYAPVTRQFNVERGKPATFFAQLLKTAGYLELAVVPDTAHLTIDGTPLSNGKQGPFSVGAHTLHVEAAGYATIEQRVTVENGITTPVSLVMSALPAKILVSVNVEADCEASGVRAHATPSSIAVLSIPAGPATLTCRREGFGSASRGLTLEPGKTQSVSLSIERQGPVAGEVRFDSKSGLEFVYLPGGTFHLGCEPGDTKCFAEEKPGRQATVGPFWLGKTEVTAEAYARCVSAGSCTPANDNPPAICTWKRADRLKHPINCLSWDQAHAFCAWMGGRLATAEEWEFAAKGGEARIYPWGSDAIDGTRANVCDTNCRSSAPDADWADTNINDGASATAPVGTYPAGASKWGLLDMVGNVWEWNSSESAAGQKEFRGAGWYDTPLRARTSHRLGATPQTTAINLGLRCAQDK